MAIAQDQDQRAQFTIFKHTQYISSSEFNFVTNITGKSVSTLIKCAKQCVQYALCRTATYYIQSQICSLYQEKYGRGQLIPVAAQTASVISLNYRRLSFSYCTVRVGDSIAFTDNQVMYSFNELYAFGISNYTMGIYNTYANGSISSPLWQPVGSQPAGSCFRAQADGNLVLYSLCTIPVWTSYTMSSTNDTVYCLKLSNTGQLIWLNRTDAIIWSQP